MCIGEIDLEIWTLSCQKFRLRIFRSRLVLISPPLLTGGLCIIIWKFSWRWFTWEWLTACLCIIVRIFLALIKLVRRTANISKHHQLRIFNPSVMSVLLNYTAAKHGEIRNKYAGKDIVLLQFAWLLKSISDTHSKKCWHNNEKH